MLSGAAAAAGLKKRETCHLRKIRHGQIRITGPCLIFVAARGGQGDTLRPRAAPGAEGQAGWRQVQLVSLFDRGGAPGGPPHPIPVDGLPVPVIVLYR